MDSIYKKLRSDFAKSPKIVIERSSAIENDHSDRPDILFTLSEAFVAVGNHKEAKRVAQKCLNGKMPIAMAFQFCRHLMNLGMVHESSTISIRTFLKAGKPLKYAAKVLYTAIHVCNWPLVKEITERFLVEYKKNNHKEIQETPRTHLLWCEDLKINNQVLHQFAEQCYPKFSNKIKKSKGISDRKIKVGYMSSDYRNHPSAQLLKGLIKAHNRDEFEIIAYDTGYDDGSDLRKETLGYFDRTEILFGLEDKKAIEKLKNDDLDIVVEINGLTSHTKIGLLSERPVPVQIAYLGFPGTVGGRFIDYIIADTHVAPDDALNMYREKIIRIEKTYQVNDYDFSLVNQLSPLTRSELGFSDSALILGMFNNCNKITEECWQTWMLILKKIPHAVIWMLQPNTLAAENLRKSANLLGVNPNRVIFAPRLDREKHYQRLKVCDLVLDPWPYGGHTTTADALFAGIPALTREGNNFASRVSGGLMIAAGLPGWIVKDKEAYVQAAINLVRNPELLIKTKQYLNEKRDKLNIFNSKSKALQLEVAYKKIINNRLAGLPDQHITTRLARK